MTVTVSNTPEPNYQVAGETLGGAQYQYNKLIDPTPGSSAGIGIPSNPMRVSGSGGDGLAATATSTQTAVPSATNTTVMAANTDRKRGSGLHNPSSATFWIKEGEVPVVGEGWPLYPNGNYLIQTTAAVNVIHALGSPADINAIEVV